MSLEDRLRRLEELLSEVIKRIERIESYLEGLGNDELRYASRLVIGLALPPLRALEASKRLVSLLQGRYYTIDEISYTILEVLADCKPLNISEITRRVKTLRGKASRRIIREKLLQLERHGLVINIGTSNRPRYILSNCIESK